MNMKNKYPASLYEEHLKQIKVNHLMYLELKENLR